VRDDGTLTGGKYLMTASAEIARPITAALPSVWWAAFIDGGRAADELRDLKPALGYGLGVRWRSPVGPLKLDWAWGREVGHARLHLSVGITF
jgi:translocation and assembly module TamA